MMFVARTEGHPSTLIFHNVSTTGGPRRRGLACKRPRQTNSRVDVTELQVANSLLQRFDVLHKALS